MVAEVVCSVLFFLGRISLEGCWSLSDDAKRNTLIHEVQTHCIDAVSDIQAQSDDAVAGALLIQSLLVRSGVRSVIEDMTLDDQRNTMIVATGERLAYPISSLQSMSSLDLARVAYKWYLPSSAGLGPLAEGLVNVPAGAQFNIRAANGDGMDCLCIAGPVSGKYVGVYHRLNGDDVFRLMVAESTDMIAWGNSVQLHDRASMGKLSFAFGGVLLVYEANVDGVGPSVAVCFYSSLAEFLSAAPCAQEFTAPHSLSSSAEGTPHIIEVTGDTVETSTMTLGMHFLDGSKDQQALAVLRDFKEWHATPSYLVNTFLLADGFPGKLGSRASFMYRGQRWWVMEAQKVLNDWSTWTVLLGDGLGFAVAEIKTPGKSTSFANPFVALLGDTGHYVSSIFVPSQGNAGSEVGELLFAFDASATFVNASQAAV